MNYPRTHGYPPVPQAVEEYIPLVPCEQCGCHVENVTKVKDSRDGMEWSLCNKCKEEIYPNGENIETQKEKTND